MKPASNAARHLASASDVLNALKHHQSELMKEEALSLDEILSSSGEIQLTNERDSDEEDYESDDVRSIITFPMLLQHTLRIWLHKRGQPDLTRILDKELLGLF